MRKNATIDINIEKISTEDFGKMMQNIYHAVEEGYYIYHAVEEGYSQPAKDFFGEIRKENQ